LIGSVNQTVPVRSTASVDEAGVRTLEAIEPIGPCLPLAEDGLQGWFRAWPGFVPGLFFLGVVPTNRPGITIRRLLTDHGCAFRP
jgi:hypothetical protein